MKKNLYACFSLLLLSCQTQNIQNLNLEKLRGSNNEFRNWWDVRYYQIAVEPDLQQKYLEGSVEIEFQVDEQWGDFLQIDLQKPMKITQLKVNSYDGVEEKNIPLGAVKNRGNNYFIPTKFFKPYKNQAGLKINFEGKPKVAINAPWDGGWIFSKDKKNRTWVSAAVQFLGPSAWFPSKDYQGDEPDRGASLSIIVPEDLVAVSNGKLWESSFVKNEEGKNVYTWQVQNPINTYNIIPSIGFYENWREKFKGLNGEINLNYYVLDYNKEKAQKHFQQVKPMLEIFEDWFGPYPFYKDEFKIVETPFLGMEHQSNIAYGNEYKNGYLGYDNSKSGWGDKFDFIIIHESGHEWFGNSITAEQIADMWVHEAFTTYAEVVYVEAKFGKEAANEYVQGLAKNILNDRPIQGQYDVHHEGSVDMYNKGAVMIHTLRAWLNDDVKFKNIMRQMNADFYHSIVTGKQIEEYWMKKTGLNLKSFFNQYLRTVQIPVLEIKKEKNAYFYRWANVVDDFEMPVQFGEKWYYPTIAWQKTHTDLFEESRNKNLYYKLKKIKP